MSDRLEVIFIWMKSHFPCFLPWCKFVEIVLEMFCIFMAMHAIASSANSRIVEFRPIRISFK